MDFKDMIFEKNFEISKEKRLKIANYIKTLRENKKMTLSQLADESGLNIADVHKIEHGTKNKINPFQLQALGDVLEIDYKIFYTMVGFLDPEDFQEDINLKINEIAMRTVSINHLVEQIKSLNFNFTKGELKEILETFAEFKREDSVELMEFLKFIRYKKNLKK